MHKLILESPPANPITWIRHTPLPIPLNHLASKITSIIFIQMNIIHVVKKNIWITRQTNPIPWFIFMPFYNMKCYIWIPR